jgi:hypothetical protein
MIFVERQSYSSSSPANFPVSTNSRMSAGQVAHAAMYVTSSGTGTCPPLQICRHVRQHVADADRLNICRHFDASREVAGQIGGKGAAIPPGEPAA